MIQDIPVMIQDSHVMIQGSPVHDTELRKELTASYPERSYEVVLQEDVVLFQRLLSAPLLVDVRV